jgi:hypothetical protein
MEMLKPHYQLPSDTYYFRATLLPELYNATNDKLKSVLTIKQYISFTTDTWTPHNVQILCLAASQHNGLTARGSDVQTGCCLSYSLLARQRQNYGRRSFRTQLHTLQLCAKRGLGSQRAVNDALAVCCQFASHFLHSVLVKESLSEAQLTVLNTPDHQIIQDVLTRWNPTFYMVERLLEHRRPLTIYMADNDVTLPSSNQVTVSLIPLKLWVKYTAVSYCKEINVKHLINPNINASVAQTLGS